MKNRNLNHKDDWATPKEFYDKLNKEFSFDFDPCPLFSEFDGLSIDWGKSNFVNPPYSKLREFVYKAIERCNPNLQILTELSYSSNIDFLLPKNSPKRDYTFSTLYTAGEVYISAIIDTLTAQAFYNPHIVTILQQILVGRGEKAPDEFELMMEKTLGNFNQSNLY